MGKLWSYAVDTLVDPVQVFRKVREEPAVVWSILVVCVVSLASFSIEPPWGAEPFAFTLGRATGQIVAELIYFLIYVALVHGAARLLGARGRFAAIFTAFGFAALPMLVNVPVYLLLESVRAAGAAQIGLYAFVIWSFVLSVLAIREVYEVSTGKAVGVIALAVLGPVAVIVLLMVVLGISLAGLLSSVAGM